MSLEDLAPCCRCGTSEQPYRQLPDRPNNFMPFCEDCYAKRILEYQRDYEAKIQARQEQSLEENSDFCLEETVQPQKPINLFSQGWHMSIEETTSELSAKNIVVLVNRKNEKLYMRATKMQNSLIELQPITKQEAIENQINISESLNETYFEGEFSE